MWGVGCGVRGVGCGVWGLGFRVCGVGFVFLLVGVQVLGVEGVGVQTNTLLEYTSSATHHLVRGWRSCRIVSGNDSVLPIRFFLETSIVWGEQPHDGGTAGHRRPVTVWGAFPNRSLDVPTNPLCAAREALKVQKPLSPPSPTNPPAPCPPCDATLWGGFFSNRVPAVQPS